MISNVISIFLAEYQRTSYASYKNLQLLFLLHCYLKLHETAFSRQLFSKDSHFSWLSSECVSAKNRKYMLECLTFLVSHLITWFKKKTKTEKTRGFLHLPGSCLIEIWSKSCPKSLAAKYQYHTNTPTFNIYLLYFPNAISFKIFLQKDIRFWMYFVHILKLWLDRAIGDFESFSVWC